MMYPVTVLINVLGQLDGPRCPALLNCIDVSLDVHTVVLLGK